MSADQIIEAIEALTPNERSEVLRKLYGRSVWRHRHDGIEATFARYRKAMLDVSGVDVTEHTRKRPVVWARNIVVSQMVDGGYTRMGVARCVGLAHCTLCYCRDSVAEMLASPQYYPEEMELYRKFKTAIQ